MVPEQARIVIIGGGIMGCGLAYHLAREGCADVVLLEKAELTSGSTWHAAGQITRSISSQVLGRCVDYNIALYSGQLEHETGQPVSWHPCGSLRLAYDTDALDWLRYTVSVGRGVGFPMEIIGPERIAQLHPFYALDGVVAALHTPGDGHVDPAGVTFALAEGARQAGVKILRRCRALAATPTRTGEWTVETEAGAIRCEHVVNAGGTYARQFACEHGYDLPTTSMTHHYLVTEPVAEFAALETELPVIRDDRYVSGYLRMEQQAGLIGIYEKSGARAVWTDHCPWEAEHELFTPAPERIAPWLEQAMTRMPVLAGYGIRRIVHGAISHTPDGNPLVGPAPGLRNYWCCCGVQIGIGWGPALSRELARWMLHGTADLSMRAFDPRRFGAFATPEYQIAKAEEDFRLRHEIPFPHFNRLAARPWQPAPLYETLRERGAVFEEIGGHERPRWFARGDTRAADIYGFRRTKLHDIVGAEVRAVRTAAGIMDISAFAKLEVSGRDAEALLDRVVCTRLPSAVGRIGLGLLLNRAGRIEVEACIARAAADRFYLVCTAVMEQRLCDHLAFARRVGEAVTVDNLSFTWGALALNGPRARAIFEAAAATPVTNETFPWFRVQDVEMGGATLRALRLSFVGELGWELHGPRAAIATAHRVLHNAGRNHGMIDYGSFAMDSMRMEKAYPGSGELSNEVTLADAGLLERADRTKNFCGREATLAAATATPPWKLVYLEVADDGQNDGHGGEAVLADGQPVGSVTSIAYGHATGKLVAFAYVAPEHAAPGTALEVLVMGEPRVARVLPEAVYDPAGHRPRM